MQYRIVFGNFDGVWRQAYLKEYFDAIVMFDVLTKSFLSVDLWKIDAVSDKYSLVHQYSN